MPAPVLPASQGKQRTYEENNEDYSGRAGLLSLQGHQVGQDHLFFPIKTNYTGVKKRLIFLKIANLKDFCSVFLKIPFLGSSFVSSLLLSTYDWWVSFVSLLKDLKNGRSEVFKKA